MFSPFSKPKEISFERTYNAPVEEIWRAWTDPAILKTWWGPSKTVIPECYIDLRVGGEISIVMEATGEMGRYQGPRWPMKGVFTVVEKNSRLAYAATSWTDGKREGTEVEQHTELLLSEAGGKTVMKVLITIHKTGVGAGLAVMGLKWGYGQQLEKLAAILSKQ